MEFAKPQKFTARVSDKYFASDNQKYLYVKLELVLPDRIEFKAGQYVSIKINEEGERRSYSMATTPDENHGFHILAEIVEGGKGSEFLKRLKVGSVVEFLGPLGRFVAYPEKKSKMLFVATGSGIVPIYSIINDLLINQRDSRQIRLHWGLRDESHLFWFDNLERLMELYPNFVFDQVLSQPSSDWRLCRGHVQDCLTRDFPDKEAFREWQGYVCGNPEMVEQVTAKLEEMGMETETIHHEKFV